MLKRAKLLALQAAENLGISRILLNSRWRQQRLLILCYHGTSLEDEHEWNSSLYLSPGILRSRLEMLRERQCAVLPLEEALQRLYSGNLPPRAVAITFDDGSYDFYKIAWPILKEFGYPVTLYFTTYYSEYNRPVFDVMCSYLLWKARSKRLEWPEVLPSPLTLDDTGRALADRQIKAFVLTRGFSGREKDGLLAALAARLGIDYEALCRKRLLHLVTPEEARELAAEGVEVQLHTHRHRVWRRKERFFQELDDNRARIESVSPVTPRHFCYTGGFHLPEFPNWLTEYGVQSATTCEAGLANYQTNPMLLPRLVDTGTLPPLVFRSWITGVADFLPKRGTVMSEGQLMEEDETRSF